MAARRGEPRSPADLSDHTTINFVNMAPNGEWNLHEDGATKSFKPISQLQVNKADIAIAATIAGRGISRFFSYMVVPHLESGALKVILEDFEPPPFPVQIVHKETGKTSARVRAVVDHLVENLRLSPALGNQTM